MIESGEKQATTKSDIQYLRTCTVFVYLYTVQIFYMNALLMLDCGQLRFSGSVAQMYSTYVQYSTHALRRFWGIRRVIVWFQIVQYKCTL